MTSELQVGTIIRERYRIDRILGAGGFGITYKAYDPTLQRYVALKEFFWPDHAARGPNGKVYLRSDESHEDFKWGIGRFLDEARVLARLERHPSIVSIVDFFEDNGTGYIAMEFVEGNTLEKHLKHNGIVDEDYLLYLLDQLTSALDLLHKNDILHRDIKPSNIMLKDNLAPVLIDFGAARGMTGQLQRSLTKIGTIGYSPVEQMSDRGEQGPYSDIYALAATARYALTLADCADSTTRLSEVADGRPDPVDPLALIARGRAADHVLQAIDWGMRIRSSERPQTITDWRRGLFDGEIPKTPHAPPPTLPPPIPGRPKPNPKRNPNNTVVTTTDSPIALPWPIIGAVAAIAALAGGVFYVVNGDDGAVPVKPECEACPQMVRLPSGIVDLGGGNDFAAAGNELGPRSVEISTKLSIAKHEITRAQYEIFLRESGHSVTANCLSPADSSRADFSPQDPGFQQELDHPVVCVSFEDAIAFADWLSDETNQTYRLPTEDEWEHAARAGSKSESFWAASSSPVCQFGNVADGSVRVENLQPTLEGCIDSYAFTAPIGKFTPNGKGPADMVGNVAEWTQTCAQPNETPPCQQIVRGGSWAQPGADARFNARFPIDADQRFSTVGFRVVREG